MDSINHNKRKIEEIDDSYLERSTKPFSELELKQTDWNEIKKVSENFFYKKYNFFYETQETLLSLCKKIQNIDAAQESLDWKFQQLQDLCKEIAKNFPYMPEMVIDSGPQLHQFIQELEEYGDVITKFLNLSESRYLLRSLFDPILGMDQQKGALPSFEGLIALNKLRLTSKAFKNAINRYVSSILDHFKANYAITNFDPGQILTNNSLYFKNLFIIFTKKQVKNSEKTGEETRTAIMNQAKETFKCLPYTAERRIYEESLNRMIIDCITPYTKPNVPHVFRLIPFTPLLSLAEFIREPEHRDCLENIWSSSIHPKLNNCFDIQNSPIPEPKAGYEVISKFFISYNNELTDFFAKQECGEMLHDKNIKKIPIQLNIFSRMKKIDLSNNYIERIPHFLDWTYLTTLILANNQFKEVPKHLRRTCPNLLVVNFEDNLIQKFIFEHKKVEYLYFAGNRISTIPSLKTIYEAFPQVKHIDLSENPFVFDEETQKIRRLGMQKGLLSVSTRWYYN